MTRVVRIWLIAGVVVVAALVVGLFVMLNREQRHHAGQDRTTTAPGEPSGDQPISTPRRTDVRPVDRPRQVDPVEGGAEVAAGTTDGGAYLVREHEPGENPRRPSPIAHDTVAQIRTEVQPLIKQCAAPLRQANPEARERIQVTVMVSSSGGRVVVRDPIIRGKDTVPPELIECVKKGVEQVSFDAPAGQGEGEQKVHLPFMVP